MSERVQTKFDIFCEDHQNIEGVTGYLKNILKFKTTKKISINNDKNFT